jgi:hypothetical protein
MVSVTFGQPRRRLLAQLLHSAAHGLLRSRIQSAFNQGEESPIFIQKVIPQPKDILAAALHHLMRISSAFEQAVQTLVKGLLGLLSGIVFEPHAVKGESNAVHTFLKNGVKDLLFLINMSVMGFRNLPPKPRQTFSGLAVISYQG